MNMPVEEPLLNLVTKQIQLPEKTYVPGGTGELGHDKGGDTNVDGMK
jgi:hypothetical protein